MMCRRWLVSTIACGLGLGAVACSGLLGFDELTSDGFTDGGGAGEADVLEGAAPGADGGALDAGPLDPSVGPPEKVAATAPACTVDTVVSGPSTGCSGTALAFCGVTGLVAASDSMFYASLKNGKIISCLSSSPTSATFGDLNATLTDGGALYMPSGLALTPTGLVVAERYRLDTVSLTTGVATSVLGTGAFGSGDGMDGAFTSINAIALRPGTTSTLWVADGDNFRRADIAGAKMLTTIYPTMFGTPRGVTETPSGDVYVTAFVGPGGGAGVYRFRETLPGTIKTISADMSSPSALTSDATVVVVGENSMGRVYTIDPTSSTPAIKLLAGGNIGSEKDGTCLTAVIEQPTALALDSHHDVLVADGTIGSLRKIERNLGVLDVTWTPPTTLSPSDPIVSYEATASDGAGTFGSCTAPLGGCTITGLPSQRSFTVTVVAHTASGVTAPSIPSSPTTTN
ncbi:MAG: hypothetical protein ABI551_18755 [Polyangiaceae bacterium]